MRGFIVIEDYMSSESKSVDEVMQQIRFMKNDELMDLSNIVKAFRI